MSRSCRAVAVEYGDPPRTFPTVVAATAALPCPMGFHRLLPTEQPEVTRGAEVDTRCTPGRLPVAWPLRRCARQSVCLPT